MNKTDKIFSYLPELYQNIGKESIIYSIVDIFGKKLQCIEDDIFEVMRAHWVNHADRDKETIDDLNRLGSLFDIRPIEGESIEKYRRRLKRMIKVYLEGVGTTKAIIEVVAAVFDWDVCPKITLPNTTAKKKDFLRQSYLPVRQNGLLLSCRLEPQYITLLRRGLKKVYLKRRFLTIAALM
ncbi:MAG: hypothetical protein ABH870_06365 [bacterium]